MTCHTPSSSLGGGTSVVSLLQFDIGIILMSMGSWIFLMRLGVTVISSWSILLFLDVYICRLGGLLLSVCSSTKDKT